jgi:hypothetical protein
MSEEGSQSVRTFQRPHYPFQIECNSATLEHIRQEVERGRDQLRGERETGGVLFGLEEPDTPDWVPTRRW